MGVDYSAFSPHPNPSPSWRGALGYADMPKLSRCYENFISEALRDGGFGVHPVVAGEHGADFIGRGFGVAGVEFHQPFHRLVLQGHLVLKFFMRSPLES